MTMTTDLTPRQRLLDTLSTDLLAGAWQQANKMWFMKGEENDEWLEFVGDFTGSIENQLLDFGVDKTVPKGTVGICVASESFDYPASINVALAAKGDAAKDAYRSLNPPEEHRQRVEVRSLLLACGDGEVLGLTTRHEDGQAPQWAHLSKTVPSPTGNRVIDIARAILGVYPELMERINSSSGFRLHRAVEKTLTQAIDGSLDQREATIALLEALSTEQRAEIVEGMPDRIRDEITSYLSDDEQRRFGFS